VPLIGNVTAAPLNDAGAIRQDLQAQLSSRVRWTESVQQMAGMGVTAFLEIGSGSVLGGLIKRINRNLPCFSVGTPTDLHQLSAWI
jgi:[acyl-carrier-protein] S-malonyltransferase